MRCIRSHISFFRLGLTPTLSVKVRSYHQLGVRVHGKHLSLDSLQSLEIRIHFFHSCCLVLRFFSPLFCVCVSKSSKSRVVWTTRFCSNFTCMWYKHSLRNVWRDFRLLMSAFTVYQSFHRISHLSSVVDTFIRENTLIL